MIKEEIPYERISRGGGVPVWRFYLIIFIFIVGTWFLGNKYGRLAESSGTDKAVNAFLNDEKNIIQKWNKLTCNTVDDCKRFLRQHTN